MLVFLPVFLIYLKQYLNEPIKQFHAAEQYNTLTMLEGLVADVAPLSKVVIVTIWAVQTIVLSYKLLVSQRTYNRNIELLRIIKLNIEKGPYNDRSELLNIIVRS